LTNRISREELAKEIYLTSYLKGAFKLRSGKMSNEYLDKYMFESNPRILSAIADHLCQIIPKETQTLAGLELGGIPLATVLSLQTGLPAVFVRKKARSTELQRLRKESRSKQRDYA
jgi:orotate phosphoribosyltransferase